MSTIYSFVEEQEAGMSRGIPLEDNWYWSMKDHIRRSFLYKHSQFEENNDDRDSRPFKNIIRPILNIAYRTEGFDVKDIEIYIDNADSYYKSFLVKKYHHKWALQNAIDTFIDELVESFVDYGGVLVKNVKGVRPEVVDLRTIAFCDQTDILSGPFAIKHFYTPSALMDMASVGWGTTGATMTLEQLVLKGENTKNRDKDTGETTTPGKYIEVYEVHNVSERDFDITSEDSDPMICIIAFYDDESGQSHGVTLFKNKEPKLPFKFLKRDPIQGRALGWGGIEELFEPQMWTNFNEIHMMSMLEHASKVFYKTTDSKFKGQNLSNNVSGKIFDLTVGNDISQIDNQPRNLVAFTNAVREWDEHASIMGGASDLFLGQQPTAGTPFKSVETQLVEGKSLHIWRQGRISTFVDEIYRDWIIPHIGREVTKGARFLSELSADEMTTVARAVITNSANAKFKESLMNGKLPDPEEMAMFKQVTLDSFMKGGSKKFMEILKDEMKGEKLDVSTNIAGKQKNLSLLTDKVVNVLRQFIATPQIRQDPEMMKLLNVILESSGLSPIAFAPQLSPVQPQQEGQGGTEPLKELATAQ